MAKQFGELLVAKQTKDVAKSAKRSELKSAKVQQIKEKLGQVHLKRKIPRKRHMTKVEALELKQKAIRKVNPILAAEKKERAKSSAKPKVADLAAFINSENHAYTQLRKRTISILKLDKDLIKKATSSLLKFNEGAKKPNGLDEEDDFIYLEITLSKVPEEISIRPLQIKLPSSIYGKENESKFCIFTKDPQRTLKDKIKNLKLPNIARIIGYSKVENKFPTYQDKLKLFYSYDIFFVDHEIYDLFRKQTGKIFYERKKIPFPINCTEVPSTQKEYFGEDYEAYLNDLSNHTYFSMGNGPVYTLKIARLNMGIKDIVKNVIHGVYNTVPHLLKQKAKHNRVKQINLKTYNSISLPIFNQVTDEEKLNLPPTSAKL